ncbi:MAG TPA: C4-type zinc ribbon domain-containing protein [Alkalispirochaeta sp.]|nr:C4-type zinc ribbon domain-containing protein [Alkalispirochaeta sp.]
MIQDTIEKLKVLQDILSDKFTIQREIEELPRTLATKKELVSRLKKSFVEKNEKYEETRKRVADLRVRLQEAESDREKYESQMDQITTAREYDALEKEIRDASEREQQFRRELQREEKDLEEQRQRLEREESMIKSQEEELEEERAKIDSETSERKNRLDELEEREKETVPGLDEELLFKFERIIRSKEGEGIVPIRNGVCTGCQMILPNQFVNDVRAAQEILFCPYCSKVVFYAEDDVDADEVGFSNSDEEGLADLVDDDFDEDLFEEEALIGLTDEDEITPEEQAELSGDDESDESDADNGDVLDDDDSGDDALDGDEDNDYDDSDEEELED